MVPFITTLVTTIIFCMILLYSYSPYDTSSKMQMNQKCLPTKKEYIRLTLIGVHECLQISCGFPSHRPPTEGRPRGGETMIIVLLKVGDDFSFVWQNPLSKGQGSVTYVCKKCAFSSPFWRARFIILIVYLCET